MKYPRSQECLSTSHLGPCNLVVTSWRLHGSRNSHKSCKKGPITSLLCKKKKPDWPSSAFLPLEKKKTRQSIFSVPKEVRIFLHTRLSDLWTGKWSKKKVSFEALNQTLAYANDVSRAWREKKKGSQGQMRWLRFWRRSEQRFFPVQKVFDFFFSLEKEEFFCHTLFFPLKVKPFFHARIFTDFAPFFKDIFFSRLPFT